MTLILSMHPVGQLVAILFACYGAYLGFQRTKSLHLGRTTKFFRKRHAIVGSIALIFMLSGIAAGSIMVERYLLNPKMGLHETFAMVILALGLFGLLSGFFLYFKPKQRRILPAMHGINNMLILIIAFAQIVTGTMVYLRYVLHW